MDGRMTGREANERPARCTVQTYVDAEHSKSRPLHTHYPCKQVLLMAMAYRVEDTVHNDVKLCNWGCEKSQRSCCPSQDYAP